MLMQQACQSIHSALSFGGGAALPWCNACQGSALSTWLWWPLQRTRHKMRQDDVAWLTLVAMKMSHGIVTNNGEVPLESVGYSNHCAFGRSVMLEEV
jgi:hypothetical protein